ncbi:MAG: histidine kinase [Actinomycetota bacterium]|nr:histidine kinase [Actinomycetota bacterium]
MDTTEGHLLGRWRVFAERPMLVDFLLALVLAAAVFKAALPESTHRPNGWDVLIAVVAFVAVLGRRSRPMLALAIATSATATAVVQDVRNPGLILALIVITYSIAAHTDRRRGWMCAAAASSVLYLTVVLLNRDAWLRADVLGLFAWIFLAAAVGDAARTHRAYVREVEERARRAEQSREEEARRRVTEERMRIARELHDVVAHHIAVINVQAGAATHILERRPEQVAPALAHIREASNSVLTEIQSVVGVLRNADEPADIEPVPGLARLPELLAGLAAAGFTVEFRRFGDDAELPVVSDLAAYRIVQEALTNAYKHGAGAARLTVRRTTETVEIEVVNALPAGTPPTGSGYGLLGMRERANAAGGTLNAGPVGGKFRVDAVLPACAPAPADIVTPAPGRSRAVGALHDALTAHVASIHEQAHASLRLAGRPEQVVPSLAVVRETSDSVLTDICSVVRLFRCADEPSTGTSDPAGASPDAVRSHDAPPKSTPPDSPRAGDAPPRSTPPDAVRVGDARSEGQRPGNEWPAIARSNAAPPDGAHAGSRPGGREPGMARRDGAGPGLGDLPGLMADLSETGMVVDLQVLGEPRPLPAASDREAYGVIVEALAGAYRHGVRDVRLAVRHRPGAVDIDVADRSGDEFRVHTVLPTGSAVLAGSAGAATVVRPA